MTERDGWPRWAPFLERTRSLADKWPEGALPSSGLTYLFADGIHSSSHAHWINTIGPQLEHAGCAGAVGGFSHAGLGLQYGTEHTRVNLTVTASRFVSYLRAAVRSQLITIGFSLGAVITLLGLQQWLEGHPANASQTIRAVVLVAPAHAASPWLRESYARWAKAAPDRSVPIVVPQLTSRTSSTRRKAIAAFSSIVAAGIPVYVLYWPNDALTPYERPGKGLSGAARLIEIPVMQEEPLPSLAFAVQEHMRVRDHPDTVEKLTAILTEL